MPLHLGCSIWSHRPWRGGFYPEASDPADFLYHYAQRLTAVEGSSSFYATPALPLLQRWAAQVPRGFRFSFKIPRDISHAKFGGGRLAPRLDDALGFLRHMKEGLGESLGPVMLQLPSAYSPRLGPDLARFLNGWRRAGGHPLCVEVRHPAWFQPAVGQRLNALLDAVGAGRSLLDTRPVYDDLDDPQEGAAHRKPALPFVPAVTGGRVLVRLVCHPQEERNTPWLQEHANRVKTWLESGVDVYFFLHCPDESGSPARARRFQRMLEARGAPAPPLPWDAADAAPGPLFAPANQPPMRKAG